MNKNIAIFAGICIIAVIISIYLKTSVEQFNRQFKYGLDTNLLKLDSLEKFSYDIYFNPLPNTVDVTNPHECTPKDLRPCKVSDLSTCGGCKNLIAKCTHFAQDTKFIDADGVTSIVPKNLSKDDGYCLVTQTLSERCNARHGDPVLVRLKPTDLESVMICECKNPGYIGKTTIEGACDEVFVCNGRVKNLDVPFDQIECDCSNGFTSKTVQGTPICQIATAGEFKDYGSLHYPFHTLPSGHFNVSADFPGDRIKDPCKYCLLTGQPVNGTAVLTSDNEYACKAEDTFAVPIRSGQKERILKGDTGPDAMVKLAWEWILVYGKIDSLEYNNMAAIFSRAANADLCQILGLGEGDWFALNLTDHQLRFPGHFGNATYDKVPAGVCHAHGLTYNCEFKTQSDYGSYREYDGTRFRVYLGEQHPTRFLWKNETWDSVELDVNPVFSVKRETDGIFQIKMKQYLRKSTPIADDIKFLYLAFRPSRHQIDAVTTSSVDDYKKFKGKLKTQKSA